MCSLEAKAFWRDGKINYATHQLISDLRYAKLCAISKQEATVYVEFVFDSINNCYTGYRIHCRTAASNQPVKVVKLDPSLFIDRYYSTFDHISRRIEFHYLGSLDHACSIIIRNMEKTKQRKLTLSIGYTRIMEVH